MNKFKVVCAAELGPVGMQLWGVGEDGRLRYNFENGWTTSWEKNWSVSSKRDLFSLTAARNAASPAQGLTSLWALDSDGALVSNGSSGETWRDEWATNSTPVKFALICVCEPSNKVGRQLWGVGRDNCLYYTTENQSSGQWSTWVRWQSPQWKGFQNATALTAAHDAYGLTALWALDNGVLVSRGLGPGGWSDWVTNPTPVKFARICVCKQGGGLGRALWAVGEKGELWWSYQPDPMQGGWTEWKEFPGPGQPVKSLCVGRSEVRVTLFALTKDDSLHDVTQTTADHDWADFITESKWDLSGARPPSKPSLLTEIATVLGREKDSKYRGVTYEATSHNTFTLLDTPGLWDKSSTAPNPIPACEKLLDQIADTIGQARTIVDIAVMNDLSGVLPGRGEGSFPVAAFRKL